MSEMEVTFEKIRDADVNADAHWKIVVYNIVRDLATRKPSLNVKDVRECLEFVDASTHTLAALGPIMLRGKREGWLVPESRVLEGYDRPHSPITQWKSLLYKESV